MGFLPIILSLLGFVLLWGIVNYNSIRIRKNEAEIAEEEVFESALRRNQHIRKLEAVQQQEDSRKQLLGYLVRQLDERKRGEVAVSEKLGFERKISNLLSDITSVGGNEAFNSAYEALQEAHQNYLQAALRYKRRARDYNELILKNPSRILAGLAGFKPKSGI